MPLVAWWALGYAALLVAAATFAWYIVSDQSTAGLTGQLSTAWGVLFLGVGLIHRALKGHGWPFVSPVDTMTGIALLMLLFYTVWAFVSREWGIGLFATAIALVLVSWGLPQQINAPITHPLPTSNVLISSTLTMCGGACLGLSAAIGLSSLAHTLLAARLASWHWLPERATAASSELFIRSALFCLAISLAIDVWWVQKLELAMASNAQQAGIAIAWLIYFAALRLRAHPRWYGWAWAAILVVGFICVLPILINVPWLETTLPL